MANGIKSGDVRILIEPIKGAINYAIEQSIDGGTTWTNGKYSTSSRIHLAGYQAGTNVRFRVRALGRKDRKSDMSEASIWIS